MGKEQNDNEIRPHPAYRRLVLDTLTALDRMSPEDRELALLFLALMVANQTTKNQGLETPVRILGKEA